jgi:hypothetical protein
LNVLFEELSSNVGLPEPDLVSDDDAVMFVEEAIGSPDTVLLKVGEINLPVIFLSFVLELIPISLIEHSKIDQVRVIWLESFLIETGEVKWLTLSPEFLKPVMNLSGDMWIICPKIEF